MMARADRLIREAEGKYERSKAHELQGKGNATGKLVEGELPDDAAERKALMDQALADRRKERLKYMTHDELIDDAAQFRGDMDEDERYALMERCARGEPMRFVEVPENSLLRRPLLNYRCLYPHPLPIDSGKGRGGDLKITKLDNDLAMRDLNHLKANDRAWRAVTKNKPWCLEELYLTGYEINWPNDDNNTPFHLAAHFGYIECVRVFIHAGCDVNVETTSGVTPTYNALAAGHIDLAALLQEHGGLKRVTPKLHGVRTIVDVAGDRRGRSHLDDLAEEHRRPPSRCSSTFLRVLWPDYTTAATVVPVEVRRRGGRATPRGDARRRPRPRRRSRQQQPPTAAQLARAKADANIAKRWAITRPPSAPRSAQASRRAPGT